MASKSERRTVRIIPAVPRKFERTTNGELNRQGPYAVLPAPTTTQDFGIEKYGKLPPPFYPATQPTTTPSDVDRSDEKIEEKPSGSFNGPFVQPTSTNGTMNDQPAETSGTLQPATPPRIPAYPANPTPPADELLDSTPAFYPLQAHVPFVPLKHQPTPPSDVTPSPTNSAYQHHPYANNISIQPPQYLDQVDQSTMESAYQGYSYAPSQAHRQRLSHPYNASGYSVCSDHVSEVIPISQDVTSETSAPGAELLINGQSSVVDPSPQESHAVASPDGFTGSSVEPGIAADVEDRSFEDQNSDDLSDPREHPTLNGGLAQVHLDDTGEPDAALPTEDSPREVWRNTVFSDLQHVSLDPPFSSLSVSAFLMQQFDLPQYADCRLCVVFSNNRFKHEELSLHRVVIAQSPPLAALLGSGETDNNGLSLVHLEVPSSFVDPITVRCALRICYGQSPWDFVGLEKSEKSSQLVREDWINWMQNALAFAASGIILQLVDVVSRGTQIASSIVGWDNIETALKFVMEGVVEDVPENNSNAETVQQLQGLGISNGSAPSTISMQPLGKVNPSMTILRPYTHGVAAYRLKQVCLRFMSDQLSLFKDWTLNKSAPPLTYLDRLPIKVDSRPSSSSSRLCHIQFGSLPREVPEDSDSVGFQLSSIVLSMPFVLLQELIEQIEHVVSTEMIMSIVAERERRRQTVLRDKYVSYSQRLAMPETWAPVGWQEVLKAVDIDGTRQTTILRTWTGFRNPLDVQ